MRALRFALSAAACITLMMGISGSSEAQDVFKLELCNKYSSQVKVALVHRAAPGQDRFVARGWFAVDPGKCGDGDLPRGPFAVFAYAGSSQSVDKTWGGNLRVCVAPDSNFQNVLVPSSRCKQGEVLVGFQPFDQPSDATVSFNLE
jgi:uncharacterized membrane protein